MSSGEVTEEIKRFIHDNIHSVEQLEVLLLLARSSGEEFDAAAVSQKLYSQPESAATRLADLQARHMLSMRSEGGKLIYKFAPASEVHLRTINSLDAAYRLRKDSIIKEIFSRPTDKLRSFSDAFRIRRQD